MNLPPGMSVRAISQANSTDKIIAGMSLTTENKKLIQSALSVPGSVNALTQLSKPYTAALPGGARLKLPDSKYTSGSPIATARNIRNENSATRIGRSRKRLDMGRIISLAAFIETYPE